ncbi:NAD(P)-binding protein [Xylariaceae sp. FL0594]|nr:NAD(P)-binding protein [Xylariaceae sp. FL0594]
MAKKSAFVMVRVAIAGAGGFAALLAHELSARGHAVLVLSSRRHPELEDADCQVAVVDYHDTENLEFTLEGVDLVISTISGAEQLNLIDAAGRARVQTFVPSQFEGALSHRPNPDPFDNYSTAALEQLRIWSSSRNPPMKYTVFSCGIFYERFARGGLGLHQMGGSHRLHYQGDYMIDVGRGKAEIPAETIDHRPVYICLTSAVDVAGFVAAAVDLGINSWPREFRMRGARLSTQRILQYCVEVMQNRVEFQVVSRPYSEIVDWLNYYERNAEEAKWFGMQHLLQTANGRYSFGDANLNDLVNYHPMKFRDWLYAEWGDQAQ